MDCVMMQVKLASGGYINAPYRQDAVLVNLGALMQNWTSDQYMATVRQAVYVCTFQHITLFYTNNTGTGLRF